MISGMGAERFGILSIAWVLLTYLAELGVGTATTYYGAAAIGAGRDRELGAVIWTTTALQSGVGLVIGIALAVGAPLLVGHALKIPPALAADGRTAKQILSASLPLLCCASSFHSVLEATQRCDVVRLEHLPRTTASYVLTAIAAHFWCSVASVITLIVA